MIDLRIDGGSYIGGINITTRSRDKESDMVRISHSYNGAAIEFSADIADQVADGLHLVAEDLRRQQKTSATSTIIDAQKAMFREALEAQSASARDLFDKLSELLVVPVKIKRRPRRGGAR